MNTLLTGLLVALPVALVAGRAAADPHVNSRPPAVHIALQHPFQWNGTSDLRLVNMGARPSPAQVAQALNATTGPLARFAYQPAKPPAPTVMAYSKLSSSVMKYVQVRKDLDPAGEQHYVRSVQCAPLMAFHALGATVSFETK